ncbi:hypothetical protein BKA61DRAFT_671719 [Leptodontidium sp. MPI-SDFR-AT-0119]|nr:hypothetical protein BKA61DRAFT_671719 [Leptodontidium sp. MPI-SDFR-AT-0119]
MTISEFGERLARRGIRSARGDNSASEERGKSYLATVLDKFQPSSENDTAAMARHSYSSRLQPDTILHLAPSQPSGTTVKDLKVAHAAIQMKIVKTGVSRSPPTLGELLRILEEHPGFDPRSHFIEHLPRDFFLNLSAADLEQGAWKFIDPKTAGAAIVAMRGKLDAKNSTPPQASTGPSSAKHQGIETRFTQGGMADSNSSPSALLYRQQEQGFGLGLRPGYEYGNGVTGPPQLPFAVPYTHIQNHGYGAKGPVSSYTSLFPPSWGPTPTTAYETTIPTEQSRTGGDSAQVCQGRVNINGYPYLNHYPPTFAQYVAPQVSMVGSASPSTRVPYDFRMYTSRYSYVHGPAQHHMVHVHQRPPPGIAPLQYGVNPFGAGYASPAPATRPIEPNQPEMSMNVQRPLCKSVPSHAMTTSTAHLPFNPSRSRQGVDPILTLETLRRAIGNNVIINPNYKGEIDNYAIRNGSCTDQINCSVHVEGFDPNITQKEMLSLAQFAKVAALNTHEPLLPKHPTVAADYTFFKRIDAERFLSLGLQGQLSLPGCQLSFRWNMNKVCPASREERTQSRFLSIEGPNDMISTDQIMRVLQDNLTFDLVDGEEQDLGDGRNLVRLEFSQIRGQSRPAMKCIWAYIHANDILDATVVYKH